MVRYVMVLRGALKIETFLGPEMVNKGESRLFFGRCCYAMSKHIVLMSCLNRFRSIFQKNTIFMPLCGDILRANFFEIKNSINCRINGDLEPLKDIGINFLGSFHPLIYLNIS
jgi:hypothetical protein